MNRRSFPFCCLRNDERGAVLTILAITAVVLLLAVGLGLDTMIFGSSKAQRRHSAEYVALAAIREFSQSTGTTPGARLIDAKDRAEEIAGVNFFIGRTQQYGGSTAEELGPLGSAGSFVPDGPTGKITPGLWYAQPPWDPITGDCVEPNGLSSIDNCPCNASARWNGACFRPLDFNDSTEAAITPNSFRAELWLRAGTKLWTLFSRIVGRDYFWIHSEATAAVIPTHNVFLLDLSRASTNERHWAYERTGFYRLLDGSTIQVGPSEYAYKLLGSCTANTSPCTSVPPPALPNVCSIPSTPDPRVTTTSCTLAGGFYNAIFNYWCLVRKNLHPTRIVDATNPQHSFWWKKERHARDEYLCTNVTYVESGVSVSENYIVDSFRGMTTADPAKQEMYDGPEPLTTMLAAVHEATEVVNQRSVAGDLVGMLGIDESASINIRTFAPSAPGSTTFTDLQDISNIEIDSGWQARLQKRNQHMIFPRTDARLDLPEALFQAKQMLSTIPNSASAERMVTYIGDGVSNCFGSTSVPDSSCGSSETDFVRRSIDASVNYIDSAYVRDNIKFNFLMIGDLVAPHNVVRRGGSTQTQGGCMAEDEAAESDYDWVDPFGGANDTLANAIMKPPAMTPVPYFFYPNKLQKSVAMTGGTFRPIRVECDGASCNASANQASLQTACTDPGVLPGDIPLPTSLIDNSGRLKCDPTCLSRRTQMREAIRKIYFRSPYTLVH